MTKKRKSKRKSTRKKLGAGPPDYFNQYSKKEQLERVLDLVKESNLKQSNPKDVVTDLRTSKPVVFNSTIWSKLSYFNASAVNGEFGAHREHMKTIVYMLKHDVYEHKTSNKRAWKKSINDAIFKNNYLEQFQDKNYNGPLIKERDITGITLKDLTIILLEHRLKLLDWLNEQKLNEQKTRAKKAAEMQKAAEKDAAHAAENKAVPNAFNFERTPPNHWNAENVQRPIPDTFND